MNEILTRLMLGLSLVVGFIAGKWAGAMSPSHYSELFGAGFLIGAIATQGAFKLFKNWRQSRQA